MEEKPEFNISASEKLKALRNVLDGVIVSFNEIILSGETGINMHSIENSVVIKFSQEILTTAFWLCRVIKVVEDKKC